MKKIVLFALLLFVPFCFSMEASLFKSNIDDLNAGKLESVGHFLQEQEKTYVSDPEYYVILLNYSLLKSQNTSVVVAQGKPEESDLALRKKGTDEVVGFMGERTSFDIAFLLPAIQRTQAALKKFPNRLDIHLGITHISKEAKLWNIVGSQSIEIIETSRKNDNKWLWGNINGMDDNPREFMLQNIASNCATLFHAENEAADKALEAVSLSMIKHYPKEVYGYSNMGSLYAVKKEYEKSHKYFLQALEIAPEDEIVIQNIKKLESLKK